MTRQLPLLAALLILGAATPVPAQLPASVDGTPVPSLAPMIKRVSPAVVNIATRGTIRSRDAQNPLLDDPFFRRFFDGPPGLNPRERPFQSAGSGVIVDAKNGYVLTNAHVIENASEITVTLQDGRDLVAEVVGTDVPSDVAVLKVKPENLTQITFGDSSKIEVGDFVVAIGNPFGLQHTVTSGIISGLSRSGISPDAYEDFIQTDASINPGNSGGALVNLRGELIGINTAILSRTGGNIGIGFAIPVNMARAVMDQLIKFGSVKRGLLGVNIYTITPDIAQSLGLRDARGALVSSVIEGSPAAKAGIRTGDVITSVNGQPVKSNSELRNAIGLVRVGEKVEVGLLRDGKPMRVTAVIGETAVVQTASAPTAAPPAPTETDEGIHRGLRGAALVDAPDDGGVLVKSIEPGSPAAQSGLRNNDVIIGANRGRVANVAQLRERASGARALVLEIRRGNAVLLLPLSAR
ncbi:DegQ family serine endoprotease [Caldimonas thermodepolymerans]|jgi:periplasmic serine protease, Do/DeqQ family|uniref:DegQ family serine endoprotease n=1 Tax=Caldimonas thermodepolymerans TaxID=215580 RepID=UPI000DB5B8B4|nr:DegQ family serine endoprotease [Caldimonas thermodepolymerans]PZN75157.1 MAG: serine endoprotease DegQ [Pseudomonadota bacterium]